MKCPFLWLPSVTLNAIGLHIFKQDYPCLISLSRGLLCVALRRWNPSAAFFCERTRAVRSAWDWKVLFLWLVHADTCGRGASKLRAISFPRWSPANLSPSLIGTLHSSLSKEGGLNAAEARLSQAFSEAGTPLRCKHLIFYAWLTATKFKYPPANLIWKQLLWNVLKGRSKEELHTFGTKTSRGRAVRDWRGVNRRENLHFFAQSLREEMRRKKQLLGTPHPKPPSQKWENVI